MPLRRRLVLLLPLLGAACAGSGAGQAPLDPAALRFAAALQGADTSADSLILRMDGFERMAMREDAAIAFASGGRGPAKVAAPGSGAAEAAGQVLMPGFAAFGAYARALSERGGGEQPDGVAVAEGALFARAAAEGLSAVQAASGTVVPGAVREAGLAGIAALADLSAQPAAAELRTLVADAAPHVLAVTALMRAVIGVEQGQATRGAVRARREGLDAIHSRFLGAVAADRRLGPGERYTIYRSVAELREGDPAQGSFTALIDVLGQLDAAHAALAAGAADAPEKIGAFEAAVARLGAMAEASRRG